MDMSFTILLSVVCLALLPASLTGCSLSDTLDATDTWQMISSSNYPNDYRNNENRCWNIISSVDNLIFEVISYDLETDHDYLSFYDIADDLSLEMERFTGNGVGREQRTLTTSIRVQFTSDESGTGAGFQLRFKSYTSAADDDQDNFLQKNGAGAEQGVSAEVRSTTSNLYASSSCYYFSSPGYTTNSYYSSNERCYWLIRSDFTTGITLTRTYFHTEQRFDIVYVYDGYSSANTVIGYYSGDYGASTAILSSSGNYLYVTFSSDSSVREPGFQFGYKLSSSYYASSSSSSCSYSSSSNSVSASVIAGIVVGVLFFVVFMILSIVKCKQQSKTRTGTVTVYSARNNTVQPQPILKPQPQPIPPPQPTGLSVNINTGGVGGVPAAPTYLSAVEATAAGPVATANVSNLNATVNHPSTTVPPMPMPPAQPDVYPPAYTAVPPPPPYDAHIQY